jgi:hypothetical protein
VLFLAGDRAGVAADTSVVIDYKTVAHKFSFGGWSYPILPRKMPAVKTART